MEQRIIKLYSFFFSKRMPSVHCSFQSKKIYVNIKSDGKIMEQRIIKVHSLFFEKNAKCSFQSKKFQMLFEQNIASNVTRNVHL